MDGHQYAAPGAQRSNVQVQQVLIGERLKHAHVNFTVDEVFDVMLQAQAGQNGRDVIVLRQLFTLTHRSDIDHRGSHVEA